MNVLAERAALDSFVRMIVDRLEPAGEAISEMTIAASERGIYQTSVEAYAAIAVLERLGLVRQAFGIVAPGPAFAEMKARRLAAQAVRS